MSTNGGYNLLQVSVSPFKTILDLKKEVSRVYHKHYPQKTLVRVPVTAMLRYLLQGRMQTRTRQ